MARTTTWLGAFWYVMAVGVFVAAGVFATPAAAGNSKVVICHIPPDDPGNAHTIVVSEKAVPAHLSHGDLLGECSTPPGCDDGNACTIDTPIPGTQDCDYQPVDCDDGSACTTDWCDELDGCQNDETCDTGDPCLIPFCNVTECDSAPVHCDNGYVCDSATGDCIPKPSDLCGNGALDNGEQCDDGNNTDGDGCASNCVEEFCGDGVINNNNTEDCDDGNNTNGDGCEGDCTLSPFCIEADTDEDGYTPTMGDCNDGDPNVSPAATEVCDGIDNNCDFQADVDAFPNLGQACSVGVSVCRGTGVIECDPADSTMTRCTAELVFDHPDYSVNDDCDGLDNDCNGLIDEHGDDACDDLDLCVQGECFAGVCRGKPVPDGTACDQFPGGSCWAGWCRPPTCSVAGMFDCGGECSYLTDTKHCGSCFNTCPTIEVAGILLSIPCNQSTLECDYECLPGWYDCDGLVENGCESQDPACPTCPCWDGSAESAGDSLEDIWAMLSHNCQNLDVCEDDIDPLAATSAARCISDAGQELETEVLNILGAERCEVFISSQGVDLSLATTFKQSKICMDEHDAFTATTDLEGPLMSFDPACGLPTPGAP